LSEETHSKVRFIAFMIAQFAKAYKMFLDLPYLGVIHGKRLQRFLYQHTCDILKYVHKPLKLEFLNYEIIKFS
jgi:hypothetical protein